jgi:uncharacterized protein
MKTGELQNSRATLHGAVLIAALAIVNAGPFSLAWPWHLLLPLLIYGSIVLLISPLRRTAPKLSIGSLGGWPLAFTAVLALSTMGVLVGFQALMQPDTSELAEKLPVAVFGNLLLAGMVISVVNAVLEEVMFRGILWDLIGDEWKQAVALVATAAIFGLGHLHGYPPGLVGAVLAGLYGLMLGALRWWTGGLGLAIACHMAADATIFCILANKVLTAKYQVLP